MIAWSSFYPLLASVSGIGMVNGLSPGTDTIKYKVTNSCGTSFTIKSVTVNPLPNAGVIVGFSSVCVMDSSITMSDTGSVGVGVWSSYHPLLATISGTGVVKGISFGIDTIQYTTTNSCGTVFAIVPVSVDPHPKAGTIVGPVSVCAGAAITMSDTGSVGVGVWGNYHPLLATVSGIGIVHGISPGIDTIKYTVANSCGISISMKPVTVNPLPNAGTIISLSSVCEMSAISMSDTGSIGVGLWSSYYPSVATVSGMGLVNGISSGIDTIQYTTTNSCGTAFAIIPVTVNPLPKAGTIIGLSVVCAGFAISLSDTGSIGVGVWRSIYPSTATVSGTGLVNGISFGIDTIQYSITNSCGTSFTIKPITVDGMPKAGIITGPTSVCSAAYITLTDTTPSGLWSATNPCASVLAGIVTGSIAGIDTIRYMVSNSCGADTASLVITVNPYAGIITGVDTVSVGSSITLTDTIPGGLWSSSFGKTTVSSAGLVTGVLPGADIINYTVTNICGVGNAQKSIYVIGSPLIFNGVPSLQEVNIHPNPTQNNITITASTIINSVVITNVIGQKVFSGVYNAKEVAISLNQLSSGVYVVKINDSKVYKIIKE